MRHATIALFLALAVSACTSPTVHYAGADASLPFSNAVLAGDTLYVAGHLGLDPATQQPPPDPADEARLLLDAFAATLARASMTMDQLVSVQVHCPDPALYATFNAAYRERFHGPFPARAFLGSGPLLRGCRFEMLGIARR